MTVSRHYFYGLLLATVLAGCGSGPNSYGHSNSGSGGSGSGSGSGGSQPGGGVQGIYYGQFTAPGTAGSTQVYGAIGAAGYSFVSDVDGHVYLLPAMPNPASISGAVLGYAAPGMTLPSGQSTAFYNMAGAATANGTTYYGSVTGTLTDGALSGGNLSLSYQQGSQAASPVSVLAGTHTEGAYWGTKTSLSMTIQADGSFTGTDASGCSLSGKITNAANGQNLFSVSIDIAGARPCPGQLSGGGYVDRNDYSGLVNTGDYYLYINATNGVNAIMLVIKLA